MKKRLTALFFVVLFCMNLSTVLAAPEVPEDIFKWVQSSSRTSYFFNRQQICFGKNEDGTLNKDLLIVPVLKVFDDIMINDTVSKRRWNGLNLDGFGDLVGVAEYTEINLQTNEISIRQIDYLDSTWTTIDTVKPERTVALQDLSEKSLDYKFYARIIDFAKRNQVKLGKRTDSQLSEEDYISLLGAQAQYRSENKPEKPEDNEDFS